MPNPYEFVRYPGKPYPQTHPHVLATMAALYGMEPVDIQKARVLEIGCCDGGNLIPMAASLPGSEFVGIDLTELDITSARESAAARNIHNAAFHTMDLTTLPGDLGQFDYIVAHGVYSWVPAEACEKLLAAIRASLSLNGVAYVSYNAKPGGHVRQMIREMLLFHIRDIEDSSERMARAREFLEFLNSVYSRGSEPALVGKQIRRMLNQPDWAVYHDELSTDYRAVHFYEFAAHAERCGLRYVSDESYFVSRPEILGSECAPTFVQAMETFSNDPRIFNQYFDFVVCAFFHQSLLCHREIDLERPVRPERLMRFYFRSPASVGKKDRDDGAESFTGIQGVTITTGSPFVRGVMHALIDAYPGYLSYGELARVGSVSQEEVCGTLLALMNMGIVGPSLFDRGFPMS
jgi:SAM-dependent methyltransferase